jgi:hypothetical protein
VTDSRTALVNLALVELGMEPVQDVDADQTKAAVIARALLDATLDEVLRELAPKCARLRLQLAQVANADGTAAAPAWGYRYQYQLPADTVRVLAVEGQTLDTWTREDDKLLTDAASVYVLLVRRLPVARVDPSTIGAIAEKLAAKMALPLAGSRTMADGHRAAYLDQARLAKAVSAQEGMPRQREDAAALVTCR